MIDMIKYRQSGLCVIGTLCTLVILGCEKKGTSNAEPGSAIGEPTAYSAPKTTNDAQEDMIGNWLVDVAASRVAGLKDAAKSASVFSVVMDPNGERTLYRDGQTVEKGTLEITKVEPKGRVIGVFRNERGGTPLAVTIEIRGESEMVWSFEGGKRSEVLRRQEMQPDSADGDGEGQ